ncbi:MAG: hypothetical protein HYU88_09910, partial [Chloroflexi bacterium]|nr:hypothetical protein [Chloroflexota bacterium]
MASFVAVRQFRALAEAQVIALERGDLEMFARLLDERADLEHTTRYRTVPASVRVLDEAAEGLLRRYLADAAAELTRVRLGIYALRSPEPMKLRAGTRPRHTPP